MKYYILLLISIMLSGCVNGYQKFYNPIADARTLPNVILLDEGQDPEIYGTDNFEQDTLTLRSKNYILVGYSSFNGALENTNVVKSQAKRVGASLVLVGSKYTNTQTTTSTLFLPNNQTTYHSGTVSGNTFGTYNGTSTTYGTKAVPITTHQRRYDQTAYYFVKSTKKWQVGILYVDLTVAQRSHYGRNTGVYINVIIENTPAFYANVLPGDVLIAIDGNLVLNIDQINQLWVNALAYKKLVKLTVLRQGSEKIIEVLTD